MRLLQRISWIHLSLAGLAGLTLAFFGLFRVVRVEGRSMEPTFSNGSWLLASNAYWLVGDIKKDDVILITLNDEHRSRMIKRVAGMGGDSIPPSEAPPLFEMWKRGFPIPKGKFYVMGDNRGNSVDSREFGCLGTDELDGKCIDFASLNTAIPLWGVGLLLSNCLCIRTARARKRRHSN